MVAMGVVFALLGATARAQPSPASTTGAFLLDFKTISTAPPPRICGHTYRDLAETTPLKNIVCGTLLIGGGASQVPDNPYPPPSTNRFALSCVDGLCSVGPHATPDSVAQCTATGCRFGTPLPIANAGLSLCIQSTFAQSPTGTVDLVSGSADLHLALTHREILTSVPTQPCPVCVDQTTGLVCSGSENAPCSGVCDGGAAGGNACTSRNAQGLTNDCPIPRSMSDQRCYRGTNNEQACTSSFDCPGGVCSLFIGDVSIDLSPLTTERVSATAATGTFCPGQGSNQRGAFKSDICRGGADDGAPCTFPVNTCASPGICRNGALLNYCSAGTNVGHGCALSSDCGTGGVCAKAGTLATSIVLVGSRAGPLPIGVAANADFVSLSCLSTTLNGTVNAQANLPGPGAATISTSLLVIDPATTTTTSTSSSTVTTTVPTTTSSSSTSSSSTSSSTTTSLPVCLDPDGDGVCSFNDNCPTLANADQSDVDGDAIGDVCDPLDGELAISRLRMRADTSSTRDSGSITLDARIGSPGFPVTAPQGLALRVIDSFAARADVAWAAGDCATATSDAVSCRLADPPSRVRIRPLVPGIYRVGARLRRLGIHPPFAAPVTVILRYGVGIDRYGSFLACTATSSGLRCP